MGYCESLIRKAWKKDQYKKQCVCPVCNKEMLDPGISVVDETNKHLPIATVDHIIPVSRGGERDDPTNWQLICRLCNNKKGNSIDFP